MKRLLIALFVGLLALPTFAQWENTYEGFDIYGFDNGPKVKKNQFGLEFAVGGEAGVGIRLQHNFGKYVAWDILQFKYTYDYTPTDVNEEEYEDGVWRHYQDDDCQAHKVAFMTGIRLFTPSFAKDKMKAYLSYGLGYGRTVRHEVRYTSYTAGPYPPYSSTYHEENFGRNHVAMDYSIGFQYKKFNFGYGLYALVGDWGMVDHTLRLGFTF